MKLIYDSTAKSPDLLYLSGFHAPDPIIYFEISRKKYLVLNDLEYERGLSESQVDKIMRLNDFIDSKKNNSLQDILSRIIKKMKIEKIIVPYSFPSYLFQKLPKKIIKEVLDNNIFCKERLVKSKDEVKKIKLIMSKTEKVMGEIIKIIKYSKIRNNYLIHNSKILTSEYLIRFCQSELFKYSLTCPECIIAGGSKSTQPHNHGSGPLKQSTSIVIDIFPKSLINGYYGDITRTICKGKPDKILQNMFKVVLRGQKLGLKMLKAGVDGMKVHNKILNEFNKSNFITSFDNDKPQGFIHSTGHGLGLEIHEPPRISKVKEILKEGNVVTVEPGLYYSNIGGVRIEDTVVIEKSGIKNLTKFPKFFEV